jgi:hypothetical protein
MLSADSIRWNGGPSCAPALGPFLLHGLKNHEGKSVETVAGARPASWRRLMF